MSSENEKNTSDGASFLHPFSKPHVAEADFINLVSAKGVWLFDDQDRKYLDGMAGLWFSQIGHANPEMIDAIKTQLASLDSYHTFPPFSNEPARKLCDLIADRAPFSSSRVFLCSSGSEAVDSAIKFAKLIQNNRSKRTSAEQRKIIVTRRHGYHGTNFGGTSAQGISANREHWGELLPNFVEVSNSDLVEVSNLFAADGRSIAAVIAEPVQGAGGVWPPADGYLEGLRQLCDEAGALLIFDEVITGFGRTGNWFASETFDVKPDLITFAKGASSGYLPLGGVVVSANLIDELDDPDFVLRTGYTYSGHPTCCAAAIKNIEILESESLLARANTIGVQTKKRLDELVDHGKAKSVRGIGGVWAAEVGNKADSIRLEMIKNGVVVRALADSIIWCPPLTVTESEVDLFADVFEACAGN